MARILKNGQEWWEHCTIQMIIWFLLLLRILLAMPSEIKEASHMKKSKQWILNCMWQLTTFNTFAIDHPPLIIPEDFSFFFHPSYQQLFWFYISLIQPNLWMDLILNSILFLKYLRKQDRIFVSAKHWLSNNWLSFFKIFKVCVCKENKNQKIIATFDTQQVIVSTFYPTCGEPICYLFSSHTNRWH